MSLPPTFRAISSAILVALAIGAAGCPSINSVDPDPAAAGDPITVSGTGFGATQGGSAVLYDGSAIGVSTWSDTAIDALLPASKPDGTYNVQVNVNGTPSNVVTHTIHTPEFVLQVPDGTVAFMDGAACPAGWQALPAAQGRAIVGVTNGAQVGVTVGTPFAQGEDRAHGHGYSTSVSVGSTGIAAVTGCCNTNLADAGSYPVSGTTNASESGQPRIQQLVCERKVTDPIPVDDHPFPADTVMYFNRTSCPTGFDPNPAAVGRFAMPVPTGGTVGTAVGTPLASGEDRVHTHGFSSSITVPQSSIAALSGSNNNHAGKGTYLFGGTTDAHGTDLPYIQLLVCKASVRPDPPAGHPVTGDVVPSGTLGLMSTASCPAGWSRSGAHEGRFVVGLPAGGVPFEARGGSPLAAGEDRLHNHSFSGSVTVPSLSAAIVSGCCLNSTGGNGTFGYSGVTDPASSGVPYLSLLGCLKD